ncbi:hypothetical protein [Hyalangium sp.]|uniref:hypothetical protein n=1 Tax=Hyalangium sp. TaxID=2028555 RepID=UPI002D62D926|nr:hypothetical protein [Hyalangium sp.]HYH99998.1 hypothetical protein [Hyalangium sp.]
MSSRLFAVLLWVSSAASAQHKSNLDCQTLSEKTALQALSKYPVAIAKIPEDKRSQGYVRVGGGCEVSRFGHDNAVHAEVMVQNAPEGEDAWRCKGADPALLPNRGWAQSTVTFCRASYDGAPSLRLQCTILTEKSPPASNPSATVKLTELLRQEGYVVVSGGCEASHFDNGSLHAEHIVKSTLTSDKRGWSCLAANPAVDLIMSATVSATLVACRLTMDEMDAAKFTEKPSLKCTRTQGTMSRGSSPKAYATGAGPLTGGECSVSYPGAGSNAPEFMVKNAPQDGQWSCLGADPPFVPNPSSAQAGAITCTIKAGRKQE